MTHEDALAIIKDLDAITFFFSLVLCTTGILWVLSLVAGFISGSRGRK